MVSVKARLQKKPKKRANCYQQYCLTDFHFSTFVQIKL